MRKLKRILGGERGQNFIEIALTIPLLIALLMGMMEVGFLVHSVSTVATAAREGARFGARGLFVPLDEIADVAKLAMELSIDIDLDSPDANTRIIVTTIQIDPDGSYHYQDTYTLGDLAASSRICLTDPCGDDTIDVHSITLENIAFNADSERCNETTYGCRNDLMIVEIFYAHDLKMGNMLESFTKYVMPTPILIDQQSIMRILIRRNPWS